VLDSGPDSGELTAGRAYVAAICGYSQDVALPSL
jgi:hypothetical protein